MQTILLLLTDNTLLGLSCVRFVCQVWHFVYDCCLLEIIAKWVLSDYWLSIIVRCSFAGEQIDWICNQNRFEIFDFNYSYRLPIINNKPIILTPLSAREIWANFSKFSRVVALDSIVLQLDFWSDCFNWK